MSIAWAPSAEMQLLTAAVARPQRADHMATIEKLGADPSLDWQLVDVLIDRHRVAPLAFDGLAASRGNMPAAFAAALRTKALRDRSTSLQLTGLLNTLTSRLALAGVEAISVKGPSLGMLAFGHPSLRQSKDLDLLIAPDALDTALAALADVGCKLIVPAGFSPQQLALWARFMKDLTMLHEPSGLIVELHWRLNNNPHFLPAVVATSRQTVTIGDSGYQTLEPDDLLLYLCVHGARHFWFRLKWLADVYALIASGAPTMALDLYRRATALGLDVPAGQMLLLLKHIFRLPLADDVLAEVARSPRTVRLTRSAMRYLTMIDEPETRRFETTRMALQSFLLRRGMAYHFHSWRDIVVDWPTLIAEGGTRRAYVSAIGGRPIHWIKRKFAKRDGAA